MDKTKAKIQELCPDVMELKLGTVIANEDGDAVGVCVENGRWCFLGDDYQVLDNFDGCEILGSPITLAVVLRAIRQIERPLPEAMTDAWWNKQERKLLDLYDLEHDNYDQQNEECKQFIGSLLGV